MKLLTVSVLVDWDSARRLPAEVKPMSATRKIDAAFDKLRGAIASYLVQYQSAGAYRVSWRLYHGWHRGRTPTSDRRDLDAFLEQAASMTIGRVVFTGDYAYCDYLLCGGRRAQLFDTLIKWALPGQGRGDAGVAEI